MHIKVQKVGNRYGITKGWIVTGKSVIKSNKLYCWCMLDFFFPYPTVVVAVVSMSTPHFVPVVVAVFECECVRVPYLCLCT